MSEAEIDERVMPRYNAWVAITEEQWSELKAERREALQVERREQRIAQRRAERQAARQAQREADRKAGRPERVEDESDADIDAGEPAVEITEKPELGKLQSTSRAAIRSAIEFEDFERKRVTIQGVRYRLQNVMSYTRRAIRDLRDDGAIILGEWDAYTGDPLRPVHRRVADFMPPRIESREENGETVHVEIDDGVVRDILRIAGQAPRRFETEAPDNG